VRSLTFCVVAVVTTVVVAHALHWYQTYRSIPPAPTCETIPVGQPEYRELEKACRRLTV
jgi:hypothetical protein